MSQGLSPFPVLSSFVCGGATVPILNLVMMLEILEAV